MSKEELIKMIEEIEERVENNHRNAVNNSKAIPYYNSMKEEVYILKGMIQELPEDKITKELRLSVNGWHNHIRNVPVLPLIEMSSLPSGTSMGVDACSQSYSIMEEVGLTLPVTYRYESFISGQEVSSQIQAQLSRIKPELGERWNSLVLTTDSTEICSSDSIANQIRNLVYKLQGELWDKVDARIKGNKPFDWDIMINTLSKGGQGSEEFRQLQILKEEYNSLMNTLSSIIKERLGDTDIKIICRRATEFLYKVLGLVNID